MKLIPPNITPGPFTAYNASHGRIFKNWYVRNLKQRTVIRIEAATPEQEHAMADAIAALPQCLEALAYAVQVFNAKPENIDPLAAFMTIEKVKAALLAAGYKIKE